MSQSEMLWVVTYDIPSDQSRRKVAKILEGFGTRVNHSVFECFLSVKQYDKLLMKLTRRVDPVTDSVRFYPLSSLQVANIVTIGGLSVCVDEDIVII